MADAQYVWSMFLLFLGYFLMLTTTTVLYIHWYVPCCHYSVKMCSGPSMQPTIYSDDIVLTEHISVHRKNVERGDVVIARSPTNPRTFICKRVAGLEGDYIKNPPPKYAYKYVPKGHVWLEGDNEQNSTDSRTYGPVPYGLLRSRVFHKVWPIGDIGSIENKAES